MKNYRETKAGTRRRKATDALEDKAAKAKKMKQSIFTVDENGELFEFQISESQQVEEATEQEDRVQEAETESSTPLILKSEEITIEDIPGEILPTVAKYDGEADDESPIFMDDETLKSSIAKLLDLVVDEDTLQKFGWPEASIESVLSAIIEQCGQTPADYDSCTDYTTKMRENVKLLFTTVIDNESIKSMLNNYTIDEVIKHVLKLAKV